MDIIYSNSQGKRFVLSEWNVGIDDITPLFARRWDYVGTENPRTNSTKLQSFYRTLSETKIVIQMYADSKDEYCKTMNDLADAIEWDIINQTPGRMIVGDVYLECFLNEFNPTEYDELFYTIDNEVTVTSFFPFWCSDKRTSFYLSADEIVSDDDKSYPYNYLYNYGYRKYRDQLNNDHFADSNFEMVIYGPVMDPEIFIGTNKECLYKINTELQAGEYLTINSRSRTIKKYGNNGYETNLFNNRAKDIDVFKRIPSGRQTVGWNSKFSFDIILFQERSEPIWK